MRFMNRPVILYRGSLKSCNYKCGYCPFSKHRISGRELEKDKTQWFRFVESIGDCFRGNTVFGKGFQERDLEKSFGGVMVVPYGEALIHSWYWEGLARLSALDGIHVAGAQTNLSFSEQKSLAVFLQNNGKPEKLRLWATFHPEMVSVKEFAEKCKRLKSLGISLCAGAVGVPEMAEQLLTLRSLLPDDIYLWINKMDGLGREYTQEEQKKFLEIDPYFWRELEVVLAEGKWCRERLFVEADGSIRICNISRKTGMNWYDSGESFREWLSWREEKNHTEPCGRKICSCYLAYGGRNDLFSQVLFGPYPVFRIPRRARAVFWDIEGTLIQKDPMDKKKHAKGNAARGSLVSDSAKKCLEALAGEDTLLFFATTLPYRDAMKRCQEILHWFQGGVFAGGAHVYLDLDGKQQEFFYELDEEILYQLEPDCTVFGYRILKYRAKERLYKLTLLRPPERPWAEDEVQRLMDRVTSDCRKNIRWILEGNCLQIVSAEATKAEGVRMLCQWVKIEQKDAAAVGDSEEDAEMMRWCQSS